MIREEPMPGGGRNDMRAIVECDKPGCVESFYLPDMSAYSASERMRLMGWEVSHELIDVRNFSARCPMHTES